MGNNRILVVDDSPLVLDVVSKLLSDNGFEILTANNGIEAIEKAFQELPDLIVLDVMMPKMNGYQVCRLLKSDPETCNIPIIILTVKDQACDKYWGIHTGADDYLSKEFEQTVLLTTIKDLIQKRQRVVPIKSFIRENTLISAVDIVSKVNDLLDKKLFEATVLNEMNSLIERGIVDFEDTVDMVMSTLAKIVDYHVGVIVTTEEYTVECFLIINHAVSAEYLKEVEEYAKNYLKAHDVYLDSTKVMTVFHTDRIKQMRDVKEQKIAFFDVPIRYGNKLGGLVLLAQNISEKIDSKEEGFFKTVGKQAYLIMENSWLYNKVKKIAITDSLTGVYNHRFLYESLCKEYVRAERNKLPLSLFMLDIDCFKKVNDTYGHLQGDAILYKLSQILKNNIRVYDFMGRYGGDEFSIILPETNMKEGISLAERIRRDVEQYNFGNTNEIIKCTTSIGISGYPSDQVKNVEDLINTADKALYRAKGGGRNRVCLYDFCN